MIQKIISGLKKFILGVVHLINFVFIAVDRIFQTVIILPRYYIFINRRSEMRRVADHFGFKFINPFFVPYTDWRATREVIYIDEVMSNGVAVKVFDRYYPENEGDRPVKTFVIVGGEVINNESDYPYSYSYYGPETIIKIIEGRQK